MYPAKFDYYRANSVSEAVSLLQQHGGDARLLAGGHSLLPMMKLRLAQPAVLIDIGRITDLRGVSPREDGGYRIGAMTTHAEVASNEDLQRYQALIDAASIIGDVQVRNRGTIGGSLAHNDPTADYPAVVLALDATINTVGPNGARAIPADEFIVGFLETALEPGEIITSVDLPAQSGNTGSAYAKFENPASGYAIVGVAARVAVGDNGKAQDVRVAVTGAADSASRLPEVESALEGQPLTAEKIASAAQQAGQGLTFNSDIHASEEYRAHLTKVLTRRALEQAATRARG
ncbi:MAG: xanthine dehydrogenase family protein subunit M [Ardenticatenaceae bacterium]|nr:xanthine dehydrogenase family protein subunit M [Ardenticatenaceae bacterium]HBY94580.1 carbon monoxide dehydrogenase [Chloroflexota bacterium]